MLCFYKKFNMQKTEGLLTAIHRAETLQNKQFWYLWSNTASKHSSFVFVFIFVVLQLLYHLQYQPAPPLTEVLSHDPLGWCGAQIQNPFHGLQRTHLTVSSKGTLYAVPYFMPFIYSVSGVDVNVKKMAKVSNKEFNIFTSNHQEPKSQSALVLFYSYNCMMSLLAYIPTVVISGQKPHPHQKICILKGPCSAYLFASLQKLSKIYPVMFTLPCKSSGTCASVGPV